MLFFGGCTYYELIENEIFDEANEYYEIVNGYMTLVDNSTIERPIISSEPTTYYNNANMASFYQKVNIPQIVLMPDIIMNLANIKLVGLVILMVDVPIMN